MHSEGGLYAGGVEFQWVVENHLMFIVYLLLFEKFNSPGLVWSRLLWPFNAAARVHLPSWVELSYKQFPDVFPTAGQNAAFLGSRDSVVGTAITLWAGWSGLRMPTGARELCHLQDVETGFAAYPGSH
jgi:hypothetical protein